MTDVSPEEIRALYDELFSTLERAIGVHMTANILKKGEEIFNNGNEVEEFTNGISSLEDIFGKKTADIMISTSIVSRFGRKKAPALEKELTRIGAWTREDDMI